MRARTSLLATLLAAVLAAPACAQILGIEELPVTAGAGAGGGVEGDASDDAWKPGPCDCPATQDWTKVFAASGDVTVAGVVVDSADRIVIAGSVAGTLDVAGYAIPGGEDRDVLVVVLDACGELVWARRFGDAGDQAALALAIDPHGSATPDAIVLSGAFTGGLDFGGKASKLVASTQRAFVARLDPATGDGLASLAAGDDASLTHQGTAVAVAAGGGAFWAGTEDSGATLFLRRLDASLKVTGQITPSCMKCDPVLALLPSAVVLAGNLQDAVDFVPGGPGPITSNGSTDAYVATLVSEGASFVEGKSKAFGDITAQLASGVASDGATGDVFLAGGFEGTLNMGAGGKTKISTGGLDVFVAKLGPDLTAQWLAAFGGGNVGADQRGTAVAKGQRLAVVGNFAVGLDPGPGAPKLTSAGSVDAFLLVLDPATGAPLHAASFGGPGDDHAAGVALDATSHAIVAGVLSGPADFGCGPMGGLGKSIFVARRTIP